MRDITDWRPPAASANPIRRPRAHKRSEWPPDYDAIYRWRINTLNKLRDDPELLAASKAYYACRPAEFIMDWMDTYDPRKSPTASDPAAQGSKWMPFVFFERQVDLVDFLESCDADQESGLIEKARDMGATWVCCAYSVWRWLFIPSDAVGWGSRKEILVDKAGDPDSIFEKMRLLIDRLPPEFLPEKFTRTKHATMMKLLNPDSGSIIAGESGDNIGRGGRKSLYIKDEAAHYERPEKIEAALGDNTNVQIDLSSVNGVGNVFHRRRENGVIWQRGKTMPRGFVRVFIMDWRDHPAKTQEWYDMRKAKYEREGMAHVFAQEVDRNYSAAVSNTIIHADWVQSAVDAHIHIPYLAEALPDKLGRWTAGLDVGDSEDGDRNALTLVEWIIWRNSEEWIARDPGLTARKAITACRPYSGRIEVMYDSIGVGAGVKSEYNRLTEDEKIIDPAKIPFVPWNAGAAVLRPHDRIIPDDDQSILNKDFYDNLKAQAWWSLRTRFFKTHKALTEGIVYPVDELISLDSTMPLLEQVKKELVQPTRKESSRLKMMVDKKPAGTKSPNLADSGVQAFFPVPYNSTVAIAGSYGH